MKVSLLMTLAIALTLLVTSAVVSRKLNARHDARLAQAEAKWLEEKVELEKGLEKAVNTRPRIISVPGPAAEIAVPASRSAAEILAHLRMLGGVPGSGQGRDLRQAIRWFEELVDIGPPALPLIRQFLVENADDDFAWPHDNRRRRPIVVDTHFVLPPSLRFGLFDVVRRIGGPEAEGILAETLAATGRGVEVSWLARVLQSAAPNRYRDLAVASARELLDNPLADASSSPLDRDDRHNLFSVLSMYGDTSYVDAARHQLVQAEGQLDRSALRYLQETLGAQSVLIAAQAYRDPRLTDPSRKEPLVRLALSYVGADPQADAFYQSAIGDMTLTKNHRSNLIEDLNEDGFADPDNLQAGDLPKIENRIALIEQLAPYEEDPVNAAALQEAYKDLQRMQNSLIRPPAAQP